MNRHLAVSATCTTQCFHVRSSQVHTQNSHSKTTSGPGSEASAQTCMGVYICVFYAKYRVPIVSELLCPSRTHPPGGPNHSSSPSYATVKRPCLKFYLVSMAHLQLDRQWWKLASMFEKLTQQIHSVTVCFFFGVVPIFVCVLINAIWLL